MTMPDERARALRWAGEFLREVQVCEQIPKDLREQASRILRHYPSGREIQRDATRRRVPGEAIESPRDALRPSDGGHLKATHFVRS